MRKVNESCKYIFVMIWYIYIYIYIYIYDVQLEFTNFCLHYIIVYYMYMAELYEMREIYLVSKCVPLSLHFSPIPEKFSEIFGDKGPTGSMFVITTRSGMTMVSPWTVPWGQIRWERNAGQSAVISSYSPPTYFDFMNVVTWTNRHHWLKVTNGQYC